MEENGVTLLDAVSETEEDYGSFQNTEDIDLRNDFVPYNDESSDCSDSDDEDDDDCCDDEVVENSYDTKEEDYSTQEQLMFLTQFPLTSPRG